MISKDVFCMTLRKGGVVLISALLLQACVNHTEKADTAYLKNDWDTAVSSYTRALQGAKEPIEIKRLQERLTESKQRGAEFHLSSSRSAQGIGDIASAYQHASIAFSYSPSSEARSLLNEVKVLERDRLIGLARLSLKKEVWSEAISLLESANQIDWSEKGRDLLAEAQRGLAEHNASMFSSLSLKADGALKNREWQQASHLYKNAMEYGTSPQVERAQAFSSLMYETSVYASKAAYDLGSSMRAEEGYKKALEYGIDVGYVQGRLKEVELNDYELVFHSAVIAPQKPNTQTAWDGFGHLISGGGVQLMANLGGYFIPGGTVSPKLLTTLAEMANNGVSAPDSFLNVHVNGQAYGGIQYTQKNSYRPEWGISMTFRKVNRQDNRIISLHVWDADESEHDIIGSVQFKLSDLIEAEGVQNKVLFDDRGQLFAQGLLAVTISSRRIQ
jgi:tetratricopeptide (TPR) repeat protein